MEGRKKCWHDSIRRWVIVPQIQDKKEMQQLITQTSPIALSPSLALSLFPSNSPSFSLSNSPCLSKASVSPNQKNPLIPYRFVIDIGSIPQQNLQNISFSIVSCKV